MQPTMQPPDPTADLYASSAEQHAPDTQNPTPTEQAPARTFAARLRYVPPVAALGTAFIMQTAAITTTVGSRLVVMYDNTAWYLPALLLGLAVASCMEGGAAYLMDLYDKHLLAGDSVWMLRLSMAGYVAVSGYVIHWWTSANHLPSEISWMLSGMSASAMYLWSRGSRWGQREEMRRKGLIDPAMPRLSAPARVLHPVRYLKTLYLTSWEPAATTEQARQAYADHRQRRGKPLHASYRQPRAATKQSTRQLTEQPTMQLDSGTRQPTMQETQQLLAGETKQLLGAPVQRTQQPPTVQAALLPGSDAPDSNVILLRPGVGSRGRSTEELARLLDKEFPDRVPGRPTALPFLREALGGSCDPARAAEAVKILRQWRTEREEGAANGV